MSAEPRDSLGPRADKLRGKLELGSKLQFNFSGFFLVIGFLMKSASISALALVIYNSAAIEALVAGSLILGRSTRRNLGSFYVLGLIVFVMATMRGVVSQFLDPVTPKWDWIASTAICAIGVNIYDAWSLAQFRRSGSSVSANMALILYATLPLSVGVLLVAVATLATHSIWPDIIVGLGVVVAHFDAISLLRRLATLDVARSTKESLTIYQICADHPRLLVLQSSAWQEAVEAVRRKDVFRQLR